MKIDLLPLLKRTPWIVAAFAMTALGQVAQLVSLTLILVSWALKIHPSLVTLANMLLIGYFIDIFV